MYQLIDARVGWIPREVKVLLVCATVELVYPVFTHNPQVSTPTLLKGIIKTTCHFDTILLFYSLFLEGDSGQDWDREREVTKYCTIQVFKGTVSRDRLKKELCNSTRSGGEGTCEHPVLLTHYPLFRSPTLLGSFLFFKIINLITFHWIYLYDTGIVSSVSDPYSLIPDSDPDPAF